MCVRPYPARDSSRATVPPADRPLPAPPCGDWRAARRMVLLVGARAPSAVLGGALALPAPATAGVVEGGARGGGVRARGVSCGEGDVAARSLLTRTGPRDPCRGALISRACLLAAALKQA